jgi:hypothetical protein
MGKILAAKYSHMKGHVPGSKEGAAGNLTKGPGYPSGGGKLGMGSGRLRKMMVWKDTGAKGRY